MIGMYRESHQRALYDSIEKANVVPGIVISAIAKRPIQLMAKEYRRTGHPV